MLAVNWTVLDNSILKIYLSEKKAKINLCLHSSRFELWNCLNNLNIRKRNLKRLVSDLGSLSHTNEPNSHNMANCIKVTPLKTSVII